MSGPTQDSARQAARGEDGTVLVLFLLIVLGVFGLLGVVVDGGRLRVTKQQLDAGTEAAALEGVRFKDREGDRLRRERAALALARQWDDDLDPTNGDRFDLGAGTVPIVISDTPLGGVAQPTAGQTGWKPAIASNATNEAHGDLVAGVHLAGGRGREDDQFQRDDFAPVVAGSAPEIRTAAPAFLVRLRRATARLDLDRDPGVSSSGPPFEWLWARGGAWQEPGPGERSQSRADGLTVRSAAIASTERALVVSGDPERNTSVSAFALQGGAAAAWRSTAVGAALTLQIVDNGLLLLSGVEQGVVPGLAARSVGQTIVPAASARIPSSADLLIVPVYGTIEGQRRIAGFTLATATVSGDSLVIVRAAGATLPVGASSVSPAALDARLALSSTPLLAALHAAIVEPVLAPVLRR